jgi:hypothetical protein
MNRRNFLNNEQRTHLKQFIVTSVGDSRRVIAQLEPFNHAYPLDTRRAQVVP